MNKTNNSRSHAVEKILDELREENNKIQDDKKIPLVPIIPSISLYKKHARNLQVSLQENKESLLAQDKISLSSSLHLIANIQGFKNWQTLIGTLERQNSEEDESLVNVIKISYQHFLQCYEKNVISFDEDLQGDQGLFLYDFSRLINKIPKLVRVYRNDKIIDDSVINHINNLVLTICQIYISLNLHKFRNYYESLWDSKNIDRLNETEPVSSIFEDLDKMQSVFIEMKSDYELCYLIHSMKIFKENNQSLNQVKCVLNILAICIDLLVKRNIVFLRQNNSDVHSALRQLDIGMIRQKYFL